MMAKRRKLTAPTAEDLSKIEAEFRSETTRPSAVAPIAQIAAESAENMEVLRADTRAKLARADVLENMEKRGLVMREIPVMKIDTAEVFRDRLRMDPGELEELKASIREHGLRMPIEVFEPDMPRDGCDYVLISGARRLQATASLMMNDPDGAETYQRIKAIVRPKASTAALFAAVVEENEVRADLSHFERGRYAALTTREGVFDSIDSAIETLFAFASKAKRSKVRSFALIFEELGDMLSFPEALSERQGLRLVTALKEGEGAALRRALETGHKPESAEAEWLLVEEIVAKAEARATRGTRVGRKPKIRRGPRVEPYISASGIELACVKSSRDRYTLKLKGKGLTDARMDALLAEIKAVLDKAGD